MFEAAIFDMDGTIVDSGPYQNIAWITFCKNHGYDVTIDFLNQYVHGRKCKDAFINIFKRDLSEEENIQYEEEKESIFRAALSDDIKLIDGLEDLLIELKNKNIKIALGTSAPPENVNLVFNKTNIGKYFDVVVDSNDVKNSKPNPEVYLKCASMLNIVPENCVVFEDAESGILAAKNGGMKVIGIATTHTKDELKEKGVDIEISDFTEISINEIYNLIK